MSVSLFVQNFSYSSITESSSSVFCFILLIIGILSMLFRVLETKESLSATSDEYNDLFYQIRSKI